MSFVRCVTKMCVNKPMIKHVIIDILNAWLSDYHVMSLHKYNFSKDMTCLKADFNGAALKYFVLFFVVAEGQYNAKIFQTRVHLKAAIISQFNTIPRLLKVNVKQSKFGT